MNNPASPPGTFFSVDGDRSAEVPIENPAYRDRLRGLQTDDTRPPNETLRALLRLGAEWLDVELGYLARVDTAASTYEVAAVSGPHPTVTKGDTAPLAQAYCRRVIVRDDALALEDAPRQGWDGDPAYETFRLSTYLGAKVVADGALYGTLCFVDRAPRQAAFDESDAAALARLVQAVEQTLERRRPEARPRQTSARLEALFEEAPDMITFHDADGQLLLANPRLCEMTGYDADTLTRRHMWDVDVSLNPDDARARWATMAPGDQHRREGRYRRKEGSTFPVEVDLRCIAVDGARQFVATGWDTTEHRRTENALREKEARLRGLANSLPGVTYQFYVRPGGEWGYHFVGEKAASVLGLSPDPDGFYDRFVQCIPPEHRERYRASTKAAAAEHRPARMELPFERPDGTRIWLLCSSMPERRENETLFNGVLLDITDRREAEQAVQAERDRFETLFHNLPTPVVHGWSDEEGHLRVQTVNDTFESVFGIGEEQIRTKDLQAEIVPPDAQDEADSIRRWLLAGEPVDREVRRETSDGTRDFRVQVTLRDDGPGPTEGYAIYTDITERKTKERELRTRGRLLKQLRENITDVVWMSPADKSEIEFISDAYEEIWGRPTDQLHDHPNAVVEAIHPADRERVQAALDTQRKDPDAYEETYRVVQPDGTVRWVRDRAAGVYGEDGRLERIIGVATDITERKRREQVLQARQDKVEALYTTTSQVLRAESTTAVGRSIVDLVNEVFGYPVVIVRFREDECLVPVQASPDVADHVPNPSSFDVTGESVVATAFRDGETALFDDLSAVGDSVDYGAVRATAVVPIGTHGTISVAALEAGAIAGFDRRLIEILSTYAALVLDRIEYEGELVSAKEEAERLNRMKSAFLANMSHEIRTPLTSIIGFAEVIGDEATSLLEHSDSPPDAVTALDQFADLIEESGHRLLETLDTVLNLSRLEAGEMELDCSPLDLADEVAEATDLFEPQALTEGIDLQGETAEGPLWARVDEGGLRIALQNLISNALKYTEEGGTVRVRAGRRGDDVALEVEDTGVGMDPDHVPELFEPFRQESEGTGRTYEGTGLGLAVTKQAIEQMGGTIAVETAKGEGSCFTVRVPAADAPDPA
ncbi:PAS domain S-box protein [Salinibacter ruber]|uniref:PAS domain S-box protein n=1 Tax=Salinibacter ruber TaxID=146919 RepID=UPI002074219B|nr:PAS domain S-box protein [Salinibacter ruber]